MFNLANCKQINNNNNISNINNNNNNNKKIITYFSFEAEPR